MTDRNHYHYHHQNTATVAITSRLNKTNMHSNYYGPNDNVPMKGFIQSSSIAPYEYYHHHHHHHHENNVNSWLLDKPRTTIAWGKFSSCFCFPVLRPIGSGTKTNDHDCLRITTSFRDDDSSIDDSSIAEEAQGVSLPPRNNSCDIYSVVSEMTGSEASSYLSFSDESDNDDDDCSDYIDAFYMGYSNPSMDDEVQQTPPPPPPECNSSEPTECQSRKNPTANNLNIRNSFDSNKPPKPDRPFHLSSSSSSSNKNNIVIGASFSASSSKNNNRQRTDTGDFTRGSVTTNASRYRRNNQNVDNLFTDQSITSLSSSSNKNNIVVGASSYSFSASSSKNNNRQRTDTGDFTRGSATTNASRHRRNNQNVDNMFTDRSITKMIRNKDGLIKPYPLPQQQEHPSFVTCRAAEGGQHSSTIEEPRRQVTRNHVSNKASALRMDEEESFEFNDDSSGSPFAFLERKVEVAAIETSNQIMTQQQQKRSLNISCVDRLARGEQLQKQQCFLLQNKNKRQKKMKDTTKTVTEDANDRITSKYLRKNLILDNATIKGRLIMSGWIIVLFGMDQIQKDNNNHYDQQPKLNTAMPRAKDKTEFNVDDLYYLRVVVSPSSTTRDNRKNKERSYLILHRSRDSAVAKTFKISKRWTLESFQMPDLQMGRSILIRHNSYCLSSSSSKSSLETTTMSDSILILPVALNDRSFSNFGEMISSNNNNTNSHRQPISEYLCAPTGPFAPDEQLDAATHLFFTIDSLAKRFGC